MRTWADRLEARGQLDRARAVRQDADTVARFGEHALVAGNDHRFPEGAPIAAISRNPRQIDVFAVGVDGAVYSQWWNNWWRDYFKVGTKTFPTLTPVVAQSRNDDQMDVFAIGEDGGLWSAWWHGEWHDWFRIGAKTFNQRTPLATVTRSPDYMEVWATDNDGIVHGVWWNGDWKDWYSLPGQVFPANAPICALARDSDHMEIWLVGKDGQVWGNWWNGSWHDWFVLPGHTFKPGTPITAVARKSDRQEIWATDENGEVWGNWWDGEWHGWYRVGDKRFPVGTPVTALSRDEDHMDIWAVNDDGTIWGAWWDGSWHPWGPAGTHNRFPQRTPITALARRIGPAGFQIATMELFAVDNSAGIETATWFQTWSTFRRLPVVIARYTKPIESGGLAALGGWAGVNLTIDGAVQWYGHAHNSSSIDGYDFGVVYYLKAAGQTIALSHNGSVNAGPSDHDWEEIHDSYPVVRGRWSDFATEGRDAMIMNFTMGFRIMENMLWMAGPANTLLAIGAHGLAEIATEDRQIHDHEYDWANDLVFRGSLPPRDQIRITNASGENNRAFCMPRGDGKITINIGKAAFNDARTYQVAEGRKFGQTFIHEMVHVWQIHNSSFDIALMAATLSSAVQGKEAYEYGPAGPDYATGFTLEGQAQIISDWYGRYARTTDNKETLKAELDSTNAMADGYFRYVQENIRVRRY